MWEALVGHVVTWGNAFAEIEVTNGFGVKALWPLRPDSMVVKRTDGKLEYHYTVSGTTFVLPPERILHLRGLGS